MGRPLSAVHLAFSLLLCLVATAGALALSGGAAGQEPTARPTPTLEATWTATPTETATPTITPTPTTTGTPTMTPTSTATFTATPTMTATATTTGTPTLRAVTPISTIVRGQEPPSPAPGGASGTVSSGTPQILPVVGASGPTGGLWLLVVGAIVLAASGLIAVAARTGAS